MYDQKLTPGGNPYLGPAGEFAQLVDGFKWAAEKRDDIDAVMNAEIKKSVKDFGTLTADPATLTQTGFYKVIASTALQYNLPKDSQQTYTSGFLLHVVVTSTVAVQLYTTGRTGEIFTRVSSSDGTGTAWSGWITGGGKGFPLPVVLPDGTDINTLREPGAYIVSSTAAARTMVNWPSMRAGVVEVVKAAESNMTTQRVTAYVSTTAPIESYVRGTISATTWGAWDVSGWAKGLLPNATDLQTFRAAGSWGLGSILHAQTMVDMPVDAAGNPILGAGHLEMIPTVGSGRAMQRLILDVSGKVREFKRTTGLTGSFPAWQETSGGSTGAAQGAARVADTQVSDHGSRVEIARSRRGGSIGTNGVPVFMWRFDHWLVAFRDKILPILREYSLPATLNVNYDNMGNVQNGGGSITWDHVQDWNQYDGIEIANHGSTHTNAGTMSDIYHEVVEGRRNLETAMPRVAVETWHEHGSAYLVAGDLDGDTGLDLGRSIEGFTESYAGRLVLAEHAIVEGKTGSFYPPLTGHPQIGQSHYSMDRQTSAESIETIKYAQTVGRGLTGYTHPGLMDGVNIGGKIYYATYNADGSVDLAYPEGSTTHYATEAALRDWATTNGHIVHMPLKDFRATCAWLAAERDAGRLMIMTGAGGGFADKSHGRRENLLVNSGFDGTSGWSSTSGWTITNPGPDVVLSSTASATRFTQDMLLFTRFGWAMGAAHELKVRVSATKQTELLLRVEESGNPANWATSKTITVPGDGQERDYRLNLTLPRDRNITQMTVYIGGPSMTIHGAPVLAAI